MNQAYRIRAAWHICNAHDIVPTRRNIQAMLKKVSGETIRSQHVDQWLADYQIVDQYGHRSLRTEVVETERAEVMSTKRAQMSPERAHSEHIECEANAHGYGVLEEARAHGEHIVSTNEPSRARGTYELELRNGDTENPAPAFADADKAVSADENQQPSNPLPSLTLPVGDALPTPLPPAQGATKVAGFDPFADLLTEPVPLKLALVTAVAKPKRAERNADDLAAYAITALLADAVAPHLGKAITKSDWRKRNKNSALDLHKAGNTPDEVLAAFNRLHRADGTPYVYLKWLQEAMVAEAVRPVTQPRERFRRVENSWSHTQGPTNIITPIRVAA